VWWKLWAELFRRKRSLVACGTCYSPAATKPPLSFSRTTPSTNLQASISMHQASAISASLDFLLPSSHSTYGTDRRKDIGYSLALPQLTPHYFEAPIRDGLRTPPADDMSTAYRHPQYNNYGTKHDVTYSSPVATSSNGSHYSGPTVYSGTNGVTRSHSVLSQPSSASVASTVRNEAQAARSIYNRQQSPQPASRKNTLAPPEGVPRRKSANSDVILPNLQIPHSINNSGGSLAEFAAQITCLFWFESTDTLHQAEELTSASPIKRLREEALPSSGFRKWVVTILSTTQVTQNVILLALLFIYRLKTINPAVKGRSGSEYRLLTVALMLGNKFLDDNTYTNKTWAEVSGISVTEIHVMEVEFLSNMRYSLLASKEQWQEWQVKLGKFWVYCDRAMNAPLPLPSPVIVPTLHPTLPSPPSSMQASPPSLTNMHSSTSGSFTYNQHWPANYVAPHVSPLPTVLDELRSSSRKRSCDDDAEESTAKRVTRSSTAGQVSFTPANAAIRHDAPRLPVPNLTISTSQPMNTNYNGLSSFSQNVPLLPPLSGRTMSTVYPTTPSWTPQLPMLTPTGQQNQHGSHSVSGSAYGTPSRRQSPRSVQDLLSLGSSPISANFPGHNPGHISPSFFLQQRASPYKPVRHVNTLLYPPPSASMHDYSANVDQMHYQPLGKRNDYRPGVVPDFESHPAYQHWPVLPQPNFNA